MKVIVNGLAALKPRTGVGHYVAHLTDALRREFPADDYRLYPDPRLAKWLTPPAGGGGIPSGNPGRGAAVKSRLKSAARRAAGLHFALAARGADVYHEPNFLPFPTRLPTVVTVHDLSVVRHPEWHPADRVDSHCRQFARAVRAARAVIVVSESVREELLAFAPLDPARVVTVHNGLDPAMLPPTEADAARVRRAHALPGRYFLAVGTVEPRKNLLVALRAFAALPESARRDCPLILAGPWGWRAGREREEFERVAAPAGARHLGYVPAGDLPALLAGAQALVYPSYYEGFGLPPVEMLALGGRVLASSSCRAVAEVCGAFAEALAPNDVEAWRQALLGLIDAGPPADAAERAAFARRYSWGRAARETHAVYDLARR